MKLSTAPVFNTIEGCVVYLRKLATSIAAGWNVQHQPDGTHGAVSVTGFTFGGDTQTTVGAAGGATALPATPTGYFVVTIDGTERVVPYYAKA